MLSTTTFDMTCIKATEGTHLYVKGEVTVRGKTKSVTGHYHLWETGSWHLGRSSQAQWEQNQSAYFPDHWNGSKFVSPSQNFQKEAREAMTVFVNEWARDNAEAFREAERKSLENQVKNARQDKREAEKTLQEASNNLLAALKTLQNFNS